MRIHHDITSATDSEREKRDPAINREREDFYIPDTRRREGRDEKNED